METAVTEKKENPPVVATGAVENAGEAGAKAEATEQKVEGGGAEPVQVVPLVINEEKLKAEKKSKVSFAHIALMEANGLKPEKLPTPLKMRINAWAMGVRKYDKQPSPKLMEMNKKGSVAIADAIQDWIEKDLPEKSEEQILAENKAKALEKENQERIQKVKLQREEIERRQRDEIARKERELKAKKDAQDKTESAKKSIEQKVQVILNEKNKIHYKELVEILGHDVGESVQVGSIKLLNVYLTNNYRQVK